MSYRSVLAYTAFAAFAALALPAAPASAEDVTGWTWARIYSGDGTFSVELPCTAEEVALHSTLLVRSRGDILATARMRRAARTVACRRERTVFNVQLVTPHDAPPPVPAYDQIAAQVRAALPLEGLEVNEVVHAGRRMLTSRQQSGDSVGQTGVIEITERSYLLLIAGADAPQADIDAQIDRFFASVEVR